MQDSIDDSDKKNLKFKMQIALPRLLIKNLSHLYNTIYEYNHEALLVYRNINFQDADVAMLAKTHKTFSVQTEINACRFNPQY